MADALSQALAWRARVKQLRKLRSERAPDTSNSLVFGQYRDDPIRFAVEVLGITPWSRQAEILRAVAEHDKTAVRSGHKVGKSTSCAILALWWFSTRERAFVILTSSVAGQVKDVLWHEVQRLYRAAGGAKKLGGAMHDQPSTGLRAEGRRIIGISTNETENMGGYSGADLLFIPDEASGIDEGIFNAIEGNRAGGARLVMFGNPTKMSGTFFDAFHDKAEFWHTIHIASTETPNASGVGVPIPGLATKQYVEEKTRDLGGPGNPEWDIRIGGNFPHQGENSVIGLALVERRMKEWAPPVLEDGALELGVDVSYYGDDETVIQARRGLVMYPPKVMRSMDTIEIAEAVLQLVRELRAPEPGTTFVRKPEGGEDVLPPITEKPRVKVDVIGVGAGVVDNLKRHRDEVEVVPVNVAESADDEQYFRLRDQLWFAAADWLKEGGTMKLDPKLRAELVAPKYRIEARGQRRVESKDDIKKRIKRSPDRADAFALCVYSPPRRVMRRTPGSLYNR